jgi:hypothetical protein
MTVPLDAAVDEAEAPFPAESDPTWPRATTVVDALVAR